MTTVERVELRTPRLLLRPFKKAANVGLFAFAREEEYSRYKPLPQPLTREYVEGLVETRVNDPWEHEAVFAVMLNGRVAGEVYPTRVDTAWRTAEPLAMASPP